MNSKINVPIDYETLEEFYNDYMHLCLCTVTQPVVWSDFIKQPFGHLEYVQSLQESNILLN